MPTKPKRTKPARIVLVDDHPLVREGLARRIQREPDLAVCGEAGTADDALAVIARTRPNLAVIDISLPGRDGIDLIRDIKTRHRDVRMLVLSFHDESLYGDRALRAGARGYIMKQEPPDNLIRAIRQVLAGEIVIGKHTVERVMQRVAGVHDGAWTSPVELLTNRELEIFRLLGLGHDRSQMATELHVSVKTVETHRNNIRLKLGLRNAAEIIQHAAQFVRDQGIQ